MPALLRWANPSEANQITTLKLGPLLFLGLVTTLFAADPFAGTWKLVPDKSSGIIPEDETVIIQERGRTLGFQVKVVTGGVHGETFSIQYTAPIGGGNGKIEAGPYDGVFVKRIRADVLEIAYLAKGKDARSTRAAVSKDGRTMTSTA